MGNEEMTVSWRTLVQMACARAAEAEMEALPTPEGLLALYPDMAAVDRRVLSAVETARRASRKGKRPALRTIRRVLIAAAVAASLLFGTLMTNAAVRGAVVDTILEWTSRDLGIRFVLEGEPLSALPEGYGPHYIPEGLVYQEEASGINENEIVSTYRNENDGSILNIQLRVAQNGAGYFIDNEHLGHERITFNGVTAYYGHGIAESGDEISTLLWARDGIEHYIYTNVSMSELFKIAENIY